LEQNIINLTCNNKALKFLVDANFNIALDEFPFYKKIQSDFAFPNLNLAVFGENIFKLNSSFKPLLLVLIEKIKTQAKGT
jgi:Fe(3+) dicitrate transport protein